MSKKPPKSLLLVLSVCQLLFGVGAGDRVVYFGAAEAALEADCCDHDHEHDDVGHAAWLHLLPLATTPSPDHDRDHSDDCTHTHLIGHDATVVTHATHVPAPSASIELPEFLRPSFLAAASLADACESNDAARHPPDPKGVDRSDAPRPLLI
jgi:hypothetical protein